MNNVFLARLFFLGWMTIFSLASHAADWQHTVIFIYGKTQPGQDMFLRGGIDHQYAQQHLAINCTAENLLCAVPIRYRNTLNPYTAAWKNGDTRLDWYGPETGQKITSQAGLPQGSVLEWTTDNPANKNQVATAGFGFTPLNSWGDHYWMLEVDMDCSKTVDGWFEFKSFISNASGWESDISQAGTPYPSKNHFAQCGKINRFERDSNAAFFQDFSANLATTTAAGKIFLQVDKADGYLNLFVNGIERMRFNNMRARVGEKIDITPLMWQGTNTIKIVASAIYDNDGYDFKLWADNKLLLNEAQQQKFSQGIALDKSLTLDIANALPRRILSINPATNNPGDGSESAIYINNVFTGKFAPATIELAPGEYRLGIGESTRIPDSANSVAMTGQFRELDLVIGKQDVTINAGQIPLLNRVNEHKVAVVPLTLLHSGFSNEQLANSGYSLTASPSNIGVLTADDIRVAEKTINITGEKWIKPMSYGLSRWQVTMLAPVTQKVYYTDRLVLGDNIQFSDDLNKYDMVIYIMPDRTATDAAGNRSMIKAGFGGLGVRPNAYVPASWLDGRGQTLAERLASVVASSGMAHEALHVYTGYANSDYPGVGNLHGAELHGYSNHELGFVPEWLDWQQKYIRSQVAEDSTVALGISQERKPVEPSEFVGLFNVLHYGLGVEQLWSYRKPISRVANAGQKLCLDLDAGTDTKQILGTHCSSNSYQRWSFRHAQNGAYSLVNEGTQQCAELYQGQLLQRACSYALSQRFLLDNASSGSFTIKTLTGQCLAIANSPLGNIVTEACNNTQLQQNWLFN